MTTMTEYATDIASLVTNIGLPAEDQADDGPMYKALERLLYDHGYVVKRGVHLTRIGRVELMVGDTAVLALAWGNTRQASAEVTKVAGSRQVQSVVLVTTVREHGLVPAIVKGTPVRTVVVA